MKNIYTLLISNAFNYYLFKRNFLKNVFLTLLKQKNEKKKTLYTNDFYVIQRYVYTII